MSIIFRSVASAVLAVVFLCVMGYLEIHIRALELGLKLTWDLAPSDITVPNAAVGHRVLQFVLFGIVAGLFLMRRRGLSGHTGYPALVGGGVLVALSVWHLATVNPGAVVQEQNEMLAEYSWRSILESGVLSSATLGMAALLLVLAGLRLAQQHTQYGLSRL
ncbi:MAG TPA: hypothetical protein H9822_02385 [Candidatus Yaniella excrementavium]|nr:hypothetical protein [Candidatus Yaniella excrementavium]